jgi:2-polyprenyl-3-methyl-5-hydroxy-6-metoxy-1,4-benzoquinol methylase
MGEFDLEGVFDEVDYIHFYFSDRAVSDAGADIEAGQVAALLGLEPGMRVLDAPCGHGRIAERLAQRGCVVVGIDQATHFIELAKRNALARGVDVDYRVADLRERSICRPSSTPPSTGSPASATSTMPPTATSCAATTRR